MIVNQQSKRYIQFGGSHYKKLLQKQSVDGTRYFFKKDIARLTKRTNAIQRGGNQEDYDVCPICLEEWDVNDAFVFRVCCCRKVCRSCERKIGFDACPLCRIPCAKTHAERLARLRRHVENEVPEAISFLGTAYQMGYFGLVKSDKKAAKIYRRAVELGDVDAMANLGRMYEHGSGVKLDKKKAERLYRAAADRGDAVAQNKIACSLHSEQKFEEAFRYYALSADQGYTRGEHNLGCRYVNGQGTEVDLGKARYWFERAAAKGHETATRNLARLDARV